jgi:hypothetical protein
MIIYLIPIINVSFLLKNFNIVAIEVHKANARLEGDLESVVADSYFMSQTGLQATSVMHIAVYVSNQLIFANYKTAY